MLRWARSLAFNSLGFRSSRGLLAREGGGGCRSLPILARLRHESRRAPRLGGPQPRPPRVATARASPTTQPSPWEGRRTCDEGSPMPQFNAPAAAAASSSAPFTPRIAPARAAGTRVAL